MQGKTKTFYQDILDIQQPLMMSSRPQQARDTMEYISSRREWS